MNQDDIRLDGRFFAPRREVFDHLNESGKLAHERSALDQSAAERRISRFLAPMDTEKDKIMLDRVEAPGMWRWIPWQR